MTVQVGVIGTGMMGAAHVQTLARDAAGARIVAISEADPDRAAKVAASVGDPAVKLYRDGVALITAQEVDAVVIASPDDTHEEFVAACLDAGKPVLCEKPLAATAAGCLRIVEQEVRTGRKLVQLGYMRRFDPSYMDMKRVLGSGQIGAALMLHCIHRNASAQPWFSPGMPMANSAVHEFDISRWLLNTDITRVCVFTPRSSSLAAADLADPRLVIAETASGATVDIEVFVNARYGYDVRCELVGELGTVSLPTPTTTILRAANTESVPVPADWRTRFAEAYRAEFQAWVQAAAANSAGGATAWDGYAASLTAEACLRAAETGLPTAVPLPDRPELYQT
jgi:myo-inositol 2-dehydrogenase/D-chiro-inositol 1-dehydrogenase